MLDRKTPKLAQAFFLPPHMFKHYTNGIKKNVTTIFLGSFFFFFIHFIFQDGRCGPQLLNELKSMQKKRGRGR